MDSSGCCHNGVNGGYVDAAAVKYAVTLNGESKGETSATEMRGILLINKSLWNGTQPK